MKDICLEIIFHLKNKTKFIFIETFQLNYSKMITLMSATISLSLGSTLMIMIFSRFRSTKFHGIYLILLYIVFTVLAILFELSII